MNLRYINEPANPIENLFSIGNFEFKLYSFMILIGFVLAIAFTYLKLKKFKKVPTDPFFYFLFIGIPTSILGARMWDAIFSDSVNSFAEFWGFYGGEWVGFTGLSIQGGVILTVIAAMLWFPYCLRKPKYMIRTGEGENATVQRVSLWVYADAIVPTILIGQVMGRWGNFFNLELYGGVASSGLGWLETLMPGVWKYMHIVKPGEWDSAMTTAVTLRHPFFLYESFFNFWGFLIIYFGMEFIKSFKIGTQCAGYFIWYGLVRTIQEPFKHGDGIDSGYPMGPYIATSSLFILGGLIIFIWCQWIITYKVNGQRNFYIGWLKFELMWKKLFAKVSKNYKQKLEPNLNNYGRKQPVKLDAKNKPPEWFKGTEVRDIKLAYYLWVRTEFIFKKMRAKFSTTYRNRLSVIDRERRRYGRAVLPNFNKERYYYANR